MAGAEASDERLLRFLAGGKGVTLATDPAGSAAMTLRRADGRSLTGAAALLEAALRDGLVLREGLGVALTGAGRAHLKRRLAAVGSAPADQLFLVRNRTLRNRSVEVEGVRQTVTVNDDESPLNGLRRLKGKDGGPFLPDEAYCAGERLRRDFTFACIQPRITSNWQAGSVQGTGSAARGAVDLTDAALAARQRVDKAMRFVGPELSGLLLDICCYLKGFEQVERERSWPPRSAKLMLRAGLQMLARHYGYRR